MAEITLNVSDSLLRKLKTLAMLSGTAEIEDLVLSDIDISVSRRIADLLGIDRPLVMHTLRPGDSLSSESIPEEEEDDAPKRTAPPKAQSHTLSVADLEKDDLVEDPKHEAVSNYEDETTFADLMEQDLSDDDLEEGDDDGENPFGEILSLDDIPPKRVGARPLPKGLRARVAEYDGTPVNPERE